RLRTLVVAPSWVGDAVLSHPLLVRLKESDPDGMIDVLGPPWALPVYARMPEVAARHALPFGHGDLEIGARRARTAAGPVHAVRRYVEKPARAAAQRYVRSRKFLWNLGTFAFRPRVFLAAMERHFAPGARAFARVFAGARGPRALASAYRACPSLSVDYAVMEACPDLEVVAADFAWDDLGSWDAVARQVAPDAAGNRMDRRHVAVDARGCFVRADDGTTVALLGVSDLIVVRTKDALLVARAGRGEEVRRVHDLLARAGREDLLR
ncbi:MAG TPA: sugar phosphate nucleotidyltransferase, partial [Planctomycetota bacterium]|nr:sugar phosphate nucleotidyltransferase [Planctomycetota bacterium]